MPDAKSDRWAAMCGAFREIESATRALQADAIRQWFAGEEGDDELALRFAFRVEAARSLRGHVDDLVLQLAEEAMVRGVRPRALDWSDGKE